MEEKKSNVVEMVKDDAKKKLSYEQLNDIANQLSYQLETAKKQLATLNMANLFKRLDYLFKVVELGSSFSEEFVNTCTAEIESLIAVPEETQEESKEEK